MRTWNLTSEDPICLTLAADARLGPTDYTDDQIWELVPGGGTPPAISLQSTYGLRARATRLFPAFRIGDQVRCDPAGFASPPVIQLLFPNLIMLKFSPFPGLDVIAEYWVPESHVASGRLRLLNSGQSDLKLQFEWTAQLTPSEGQRMAFVEIQGVTVLAGSTGSLSPVVFLTGGPKPGAGAFPSLELNVEIPPEGERQYTWVHTALAEMGDSFQKARSIAARNWEAERSRLEVLNAGQVEILTGDPDWDAALMLSQKKALELFVGPTEQLPYPSLVQTRLPDQGYSIRKDGSDYNHLWNGQTALDAYYLSSLTLPVAPNLVKGLLLNFLSAQDENGEIDWKPGLGGQRGHLNATPVLCSLAGKIYEATEDKAFIEEVFQKLYQFLQSWFSDKHDRDSDGFPEWDHPTQSGVEDHPAYSPWHTWSQGADISSAESPDMGAYLYRECLALIDLAHLIGRSDVIDQLSSQAELLRQAVEDAWDPVEACYFDRDRDTHISTIGAWLGNQTGPGVIPIEQSFENPVRMLFHIQANSNTRPSPHIFIHGTSRSGNARVEHITDDRFRWQMEYGRMTGDLVYSSIEKIEVQGLGPNDYLNVYSVSYHHVHYTSLLPLWGRIPDRERSKELVEGTILNSFRFWRPNGLPACAVPPSEASTVCDCANPQWNAMIGDGLLYYGYRDEAAELFTRLMNAIVQSLKREGAFRHAYRVESGQGEGERDALSGFAPVGFFLDVLGVRLISSHKVGLAGFNPFPWPITVKYRGLTVLRQKEKTTIIFPDGQTVVVDDPTPQIVSLEMQVA